MNITFLGTGTSHGIPVIGCDCNICCSRDRRNQRWRSSLWIEGSHGESVVIDTGPEFRLQAVRAGIRRLDAVLITHSHADHVHGLDDIRPLSIETPTPVFGNPWTIEELKQRFAYIFQDTQCGGGKPRIEMHPVSAPFNIGGLEIIPIPAKHGELDIYGWKLVEAGKSVVYLTDTNRIPTESELLIGTPDIFIIDALREKKHPTHFSFDEALEESIKTGSKLVYFTHICHNHTHKEIKTYCKHALKRKNVSGICVEPAFDGFSLKI